MTPCCRHHSLTERPLLRHSWICAAHSCSSARCFNSALVILTPHNTTVAKPFATFRYYCLMCVYARLGLTVTGHPPRQPKSGDEAVERSVLRNMVLGIDDLQHQSALRLAQRLNERAVAFLNLPLRRRQLRRGVEAVVQVLQQFVHVLASLQHKHIPQVSRNSY